MTNVHDTLIKYTFDTFTQQLQYVRVLLDFTYYIEVPVFRKALIPIPINMSINDLNAKWAHWAHAFVISATPKLKFYHLFFKKCCESPMDAE